MTKRNPTRRRFLQIAGGSTTVALAGCTGSLDGGGIATETTEEMMDDGTAEATMDDTTEGDGMSEESVDDGPTDPASAPRAEIDRFGEAAGTLHVRTENDDLPGPDEPVDFDEAFLTKGFGPDGETVQYYDFDVQPTAPAPIYALFREGEDTPVEGQLNVIDAVPGDEGYSPLWTVNVYDNADFDGVSDLSSARDAELLDAGAATVNCPVVDAE
ncbi:hypothetical protein BRC82_05950 [Halobacteriales archaeon QS_1_67_19]|nr:MAG: hypothetical protein BRC82_05950 [Halobacteriales archaeon QS_1_67_19]